MISQSAALTCRCLLKTPRGSDSPHPSPAIQHPPRSRASEASPSDAHSLTSVTLSARVRWTPRCSCGKNRGCFVPIANTLLSPCPPWHSRSDPTVALTLLHCQEAGLRLRRLKQSFSSLNPCRDSSPSLGSAGTGGRHSPLQVKKVDSGGSPSGAVGTPVWTATPWLGVLL